MEICGLLLFIALVFVAMCIAELIARSKGKTIFKHPPYGEPGSWYSQEPPDAAKADVAWFDD